MFTVLVISSGIFHPSLPGRLRLWQGLAAAPGVRLRQVPSVEALTRANLAGRSLVLYYHRKTISPGALEALVRFATGGRGILAVHSATASFEGSTKNPLDMRWIVPKKRSNYG